MKTQSILLFLALAISSFFNLEAKQPRSSGEHIGAKPFQIKSIQEEKSFYVIIAKRNDSLFKIVSTKSDEDKVHNNKKKITKRRYVYLDLVVTHPATLFGMEIANYLDYYWAIDGIVIELEKKYHYKVYRAVNINGLILK